MSNRKPIIVSVGTEGETPHAKFSLYRVGEPGQVFSTFDVIYEVDAPNMPPIVSGFRIENYPRAWGQVLLAAKLFLWLNSGMTVGGFDPMGVTGVREPTEEELQKNPLRLVASPKGQWNVGMVDEGGGR